MDCNITALKMEASLLLTRTKSWLIKNIGQDQEHFKQLRGQPDKQEYLLELSLRFLSSLIVSSDLADDTLINTGVIKSIMARCLHMVEIMSNNLQISQRHRNFLMDFRMRFKCAIKLFKLLSSTDYYISIRDNRDSLNFSDYFLKLGPPALHLWGEALLSYAETSLKYWKPQYIYCLQVAEDRLAKSVVLSPKRHQSFFLLGSALTLQAKAGFCQAHTSESLLQKARGALLAAIHILPSIKGYYYSLAKVCALLNDTEMCKQALQTFISLYPGNTFCVLDESDFDSLRRYKWFNDLIEYGATRSSRPGNLPIVEDKQYNMLQSSLVESGFSIKKLLELITWLPVSSYPLPQAGEDNEYVRKQKERLQQRLELYQLKPKCDIPSDGNCQMHALADQLYDTLDKSAEIRRLAVEWLRTNRDWQLPNGALLNQFVHDRKWEDYCDAMAKDGCWGDHLTLLAVSELFGVVISIISSVEGDNFITEIHPINKKMSRVLLLSHYAEFHYGSLAHIA